MFARTSARTAYSARCAMPLRAKVTNPAFAGRAQVSLDAIEVRDLGIDWLVDGFSFIQTTAEGREEEGY